MLSVGQLWVVGRCMESPIDVDRQETRQPCGHVHSLTEQLSEINSLPGVRNQSVQPKKIELKFKNTYQQGDTYRTGTSQIIYNIGTLPAGYMYRYLRIRSDRYILPVHVHNSHM